MTRRWLPALSLLLGLLLVTPALAHSLSVAHVDIDAARDRAAVRVELDLPIRDLALSLPLDANRDEQVTWGELRAAHQSLERLALSGLSLSSSAGPCTLTPRALATRRYDDGGYASLRLDASCPTHAGLQLHYHLLFEHDPRHHALVTVRGDGQTRATIASSNARDITLAALPTRPFPAFLGQGVQHILTGYDHLAFLLSLLLPAALVRLRGGWRPARSFRHGLGQAVGIVTAFTVAHSITLSLAALGWVTPAARWVEAAIAGSVLLVALNNVRPWVTRRLWAVSFGFGLIHGFGFAGALGELGLPRDARLLSLLGFNLGVELGQVAVVCALLPLLFLLRARRWYARAAMPLLSLGIALVAAGWLWQRLSG